MSRNSSGFSLRTGVIAALLASAGCGGNNSPTYHASAESGEVAGAPPGEASPISSAGGGSAGAGTAHGGAGGAAGVASTYPTTCEDLGKEPVIPKACATLTATKSAPAGVLSDETTLETKAIQAAIDACPAGQAVKLAVDGSNNAFLSGPLNMRTGVTLWIDTGVTLFASRNPRDFDAKPNLCGLGTGGASNCYALINVVGATGAAVMGEGTVDGRGGEPVVGQEPLSWWQLNDKSHFDGNLVAPRLIQTTGGKDFTLYKVNFKSAPKFHIVISGTVGFVVWGISVITDPSSPNTDGVDPSGATNGVIAYNKISTGDDNIAIKGSSPLVDNIIVAHNYFGNGHGMSIGSETYGGVQNVKVCDLSLDGTANGLRIKSDVSRGGLVQNVSYTDVCMRDVKDPFVFTPYYSAATGTQIPNFQHISMKNVHVLAGAASTTSTFRGYDATHALTISLDNVIMDDTATATLNAEDATLSFGPGPVNLTPAGTGVTVTQQVTGSDPPKDCSDAWTTF